MEFLQQLQTEPVAATTFFALIVLSTLLHEYGHALTGYNQGDDANAHAGRFIWNPMRYLNWLGIALFLFVGFGFLGQAAVKPWKLRRGHVSEAMVSLAGPLMNVLLVLVSVFALRTLGAGWDGTYWSGPDTWLVNTFIQLLHMNIILAVFNLLPIPPLDGSRVLAALAPGELGNSLRAFLPQTSQYAFLFMVLLSRPIGQFLSVAVRWVLTTFL